MSHIDWILISLSLYHLILNTFSSHSNNSGVNQLVSPLNVVNWSYVMMVM